MTNRRRIKLIGVSVLALLVCAFWMTQSWTRNLASVNRHESLYLKNAPQKSAIPDRWWFFLEESRIDRKVYELSLLHHPQTFAIVHATVFPMTGDRVLSDHTVIVEDGQIISVAPTKTAPIPRNAIRIDASGQYLIPGLTDAHVHQAVSSSQHLLNLAAGITTVRDMDGFPWTLAMRDRVRQGQLLAPNLYVAGTILNAQSMGWYARVVHTPEEGRLAVREQKQAGYEFIKVHNILPVETYDAIADEAKKQGLDLIGHVPQGITVAHAIASGQRTLEHFKGYILDATLTLSDEDYVSATRGANVWNCPTFYNYRLQLRGDEARAVLGGFEMRFVSPRDKRDWLALANQPANPVQQRVLPLSMKVFRDLLPIKARFLAGTDSGGGRAFMVPGFSLLEELRLMQEAGLTPLQALQSATVEPAKAMRKEKEFGTIEVGKRADLVLVSRDPRRSLDGFFQSIQAVSVRGVLLKRSDLDQMLQAVEDVYSHTWPGPDVAPSASDIDEVIQTYRQLTKEGYVLRTHHLDEMSKLLREAGKQELAEEISRMAIR